jgi:hypothetical protein
VCSDKQEDAYHILIVIGETEEVQCNSSLIKRRVASIVLVRKVLNGLDCSVVDTDVSLSKQPPKIVTCYMR